MKFHKEKIEVLLYYTFAFIHMIYTGIFAIEDVGMLIWINVILMLFYFFQALKVSKEERQQSRITMCAVTAVVTILSHFSLLGPRSGFQYISICLIPMIFYFVYLNNQEMAIAKKATVVVAILFWTIIFTCSFIKYPLSFVRISEGAHKILLCVNIIFTFIFAIKFMIAFAEKAIADTGALENKTVDLENTANVDALTGVRNRRTVEDYIERAIHLAAGEGKDFSMFMCDIDNFKSVNDTYGHDCGDQVLRNIADVLKNEIRPDDAIFRWGGEEFLMVINAGGYISKKVAERCRKSIENSSVTYNGTEIKVTITIGGVAYYQGATRDDLVGRADENLYSGKHNGKNQVVM